jgi:arsenate reductase
MRAKIYHNPRCSKSRAALALLAERTVDFDVVEYLDTPPSKETLRDLTRKLGTPVLALVRTEEPEFREHSDRAFSDDALLDLLVAHPRLVQRPIVELGEQARIGRPPERVLELFE